MIWSALLILLPFALMLFPPTRPAATWVISFAVIPIVLLVRYRITFRDAAVLITDPASIPPAAAQTLDRKAAEFEALGFTLRGTWLFDKSDGVTVVRTRVLAHDADGTEVSIASVEAFGGPVRTMTDITTMRRGRLTISSDSAIPNWPTPAEDRRDEFPSLTHAAWLWSAHRAVIATTGDDPADPLPRMPSEWTDLLNAQRLRVLTCPRSRARLTRPNRRGIARYTFTACCGMTLDSLWPRRRRHHDAALARERTLLHDLGLDNLLAQAERDPESQAKARAIESAAGLAIPDDRAIPRTIAKPAAAKSDERQSDPRFRAILAQSKTARSRQYRSTALWVVLVGIVLSPIIASIFHLPPMLCVLGLLLVFIATSAFGNAGRVWAAERAAAAKLLDHGVCPSCLYGLEGLAPEPDGCIVCPECGGAWKGDRIRAFTPFSQATDPDPDLQAQLGRAALNLNIIEGTQPRTLRTRDHRGRPCPLVTPMLRHEIAAPLAPRGDPSEMRARLIAARNRIRRSGGILRWVTAAIVFLVFAGLPLWFLVHSTFVGAGLGFGSIPIALSVVFGVLFAVGVVRGNFGYKRDTIIRAMLAQRLCPSCAEDLTGQPIAADGCVVCACGAAWRAAPPLASPIAGPAVLPLTPSSPAHLLTPASPIPPTSPPPQSPAPSSSCTASSG